MADIAASDVTYVIQAKYKQDSGLKHYRVSAAFGDGVLTYPAGGVPLTKGNLGMANQIEFLSIMDAANANGLIYKYDFANAKLRIYQEADAGGALVELAGGAATPAAATLILEVKGY